MNSRGKVNQFMSISLSKSLLPFMHVLILCSALTLTVYIKFHSYDACNNNQESQDIHNSCLCISWCSIAAETAVQMDDGNLLRTYLLKVKDVTAHWKTLGVLLGLKKGHLDSIEEQYRNVVDHCMREMLDAWLKTNPSSSEEQLEDALKKLSPACTVRSAYHGKNYMHIPNSINACVCLL